MLDGGGVDDLPCRQPQAKRLAPTYTRAKERVKMSNDIKPGSPEWVMWEDWLKKYFGKYSDWTIIAEDQPIIYERKEPYFESRGTLSFLAKNQKEILKNLFSDNRWTINYGEISLYPDLIKGVVIAKHYIGNDYGIPFITYLSTKRIYPGYWRLCATFEDYFDLRYDDQRQLIDPQSDDIVVKIAYPADSGALIIRTDYLQEYLAGRDLILIRQHDHRRFWKDHIDGLSDDKYYTGLKTESSGCFSVAYENSEAAHEERFSRLLCKDFVPPAKSTGQIGKPRILINKEGELPEFIIERDSLGRINKQKPSSDNIFPAVFFDPKVLKKYYDEPTKYSVGFGSPGLGGLSFTGVWSIPLGRNDDGLIIAWLGDLAKSGMPIEEVLHWHAFNVPPRGGMAKDFWDTQMECKFVTEVSLERYLVKLRYWLIEFFESKKHSIYKPYKGSHEYVEKLLRVPLFNEFPELRDCILNLSTIFLEYLDVKAIGQSLPKEKTVDEKGNKLNNLGLLGVWLEEKYSVTEKTILSTIKALQHIAMVRAKTGVAHSFSDSGFKEVVRKLNMQGSIDAKSIFIAVASPLAKALGQLCSELGIRNE